MRLRELLGCMVAASCIAQPALSKPGDVARTRFDTAQLSGAGWFICDAIDTPAVVLVARPRGGRRIPIGIIRKSVPATAPAVSVYSLGRADPGAGRLYWPLLRDGRQVGNLHAFDPAVHGDETVARTPPFASLTIGAAQYQCRSLARVRMIGVTARRSFVIRANADGRLIYESFSYAARAVPVEHPDGAQRTTRPSQRIAGGVEIGSAGDATFRFGDRGLIYEVRVPSRGPATAVVRQGGRTVQNEVLTAYTYAPPAP